MPGRMRFALSVLLTLTLTAGFARGADIDNDGVPDESDVCCNTPAGTLVDAMGRPVGDLDLDCDVDLQDFAIFASNLTGPLAPFACPSCFDSLLNGNETDVDCGGGTCPACADGLMCLAGSDCESFVCQFGECQAPSCSDGVQNGSETGVDCGGSCAPCPQGDGAPCGAANECVSGFCVDGRCCNTACAGTCQACDVPPSLGVCTLIPSGSDPDNECSGADVCNGNGACTQGPGAPCSGANECTSGFCVDGRCCNSACAGTCQACDLPGSFGTCALIPSGSDPDNECSGSQACDGNGVCKLAQGSPCGSSFSCLTGFCIDGRCCNEPCNDTCESCDVPGSEGTCDFIPDGEDPDDECSFPFPACDGTGSCG